MARETKRGHERTKWCRIYHIDGKNEEAQTHRAVRCVEEPRMTSGGEGDDITSGCRDRRDIMHLSCINVNRDSISKVLPLINGAPHAHMRVPRRTLLIESWNSIQFRKYDRARRCPHLVDFSIHNRCPFAAAHLHWNRGARCFRISTRNKRGRQRGAGKRHRNALVSIKHCRFDRIELACTYVDSDGRAKVCSVCRSGDIVPLTRCTLNG